MDATAERLGTSETGVIDEHQQHIGGIFRRFGMGNHEPVGH
jgi:hypothetical protein